MGCLDQASSPLAGEIRSVLLRDDDYATAGKPPCDWDDRTAREALVDDLVHDCLAALAAIDNKELPVSCVGSAELLALVAGQDVAQGAYLGRPGLRAHLRGRSHSGQHPGP